MATIVRILLLVITAILRAFVAAFLLLFTRAALAIITAGIIVFAILILTEVIGVDIFRRRK